MSTGARLTEAERTQISDAIRSAEATTAGEIYVVVANEAAEFRSIPVLWAAIIALGLGPVRPLRLERALRQRVIIENGVEGIFYLLRVLRAPALTDEGHELRLALLHEAEGGVVAGQRRRGHREHRGDQTGSRKLREMSHDVSSW